MSRVFQGVRYNITVKRLGTGNRVRLTVDGHAVEGNVIPRPPVGVSEVAVDALLD